MPRSSARCSTPGSYRCPGWAVRAPRLSRSLLWPDFDAGWPSNGPGDLGPRDDGSYETIPAFGLPALNTALLLTSGLTITIAHHALKSGHRGILKVFLALTFLLGFVFLGVQLMEYGHA